MDFGVVGVVIATLLFLLYWKSKGRKTPNGLKELPGPKGLPLIGNMHQLGKFAYMQHMKWYHEFGPIFKVQMAGINSVVVCDPKLSKEMFSELAFNGRPTFQGLGLYKDEVRLGIFQSEGEIWETHRRFLLRHLRDFGFAKSAMEELIMDEVKELLDTLKKEEGKPIEGFKDCLTLAVVNSLWKIVSNSRFKQDDPELKRLAMLTIDGFNDVMRRGALVLFLPWTKHVIPGISGYKAVRKLLDENRLIIEKTIAEHKANFQKDDLKDFTDVFLAEMEKTTDPESPFYGKKAERFLANILFDLFIAGSDSSASTVYWLVFYLCKHLDIQAKFQEEIAEVTGNTRKCSVQDRPRMPFTQAMIDEVLRCSSLVPDGNPHRVMTDKEFHGYFIPKDTWVQPSLYWIHHDPKLWGDPDNFRPQRFLSEDGKKFERSENMMAFMTGKRQCVGEQLARDSIFLYSTNIFQQFSINFDPNSPPPGDEVQAGFFRMPMPFKIVMKDRLSQ